MYYRSEIIGICLAADSESILNGIQNAKINWLYQCQSKIFSLLSNHTVLRHTRVGKQFYNSFSTENLKQS